MIKVYDSDERQFNNNGNVVLLPTKARVHNEDNGDFYLDLDCSLKYADYVKENNIIVVPTPQGEQPFRIRSYTVNNKRISVKAWHTYYDSNNYLIVDSYVQGLNANDALNHLNNATTPVSAFRVYSDIVSVNNFRCVRKSLNEAIEVVIERWGGHLIRDKWQIKLLNKIGRDNGITVEYRKNIKDISVEYDWSDVVTKLLPVGDNETMLDDPFLTSATQYAIPYCKTVEFSQEGIEQEDYDTEAAYIAAVKVLLRKQATEYLKANCVPKVSYTLKANPELVTDIGDYILVKDKEIGIDLITQVTAYEYDTITERYTSLEFGNYKKTIRGAIEQLINLSK